MNLKNFDPVRMEAMIAEQRTFEQDPGQARDLRRKRILFTAVLAVVLIGALVLVLTRL